MKRGVSETVLAVTAIVLLVPLAPATAHTTEPPASAPSAVDPDVVESVAARLREDPVMVDPDAEAALTAEEADALREQIAAVRPRTGPLFVAVLPNAVAPSRPQLSTLLQRLGEQADRSGTYVLIVGDSLLSGTTGDTPIASSSVPDIATATVGARRGEGAAAILSEFVSRVEAAAPSAAPDTPEEERSGSGGGGVPLWLLVAVVAAGLIVAGALLRRRRGRGTQPPSSVSSA